MAQPDLSRRLLSRRLVPPGAAAAFRAGQERQALTLLARARDRQVAGSEAWAILERLCGLVLIHVLREVEGTFALERADAVLDALPGARPELDWLEDAQAPAGSLESP